MVTKNLNEEKKKIKYMTSAILTELVKYDKLF